MSRVTFSFNLNLWCVFVHSGYHQSGRHAHLPHEAQNTDLKGRGHGHAPDARGRAPEGPDQRHEDHLHGRDPVNLYIKLAKNTSIIRDQDPDPKHATRGLDHDLGKGPENPGQGQGQRRRNQQTRNPRQQNLVQNLMLGKSVKLMLLLKNWWMKKK